MVKRFGLNQQSSVVEIASNDGYLLQYFVRRQVPVLGIEPAANVARSAQSRKASRRWSGSSGRKSRRNWWPSERNADLVLGNNVLRRFPDLNDFVEGFKILLKPRGSSDP